MSYIDSLDIANQACRVLGLRKIQSPTEDTPQNHQLADAYDAFLDVELMRNVWTFACKRTVLRPLTPTTMLIQPAQWLANQLYLPGSIVADPNGDLWVSVTPENINNVPGTSDVWDQYFGPMTADLYQSTTTYYAGELVYKPLDGGSFVIFACITNGATEDPGVADAWSATTQYQINDVVSYGGSMWRSLIPYNFGVTPTQGPLAYDPSTTYATGNTVVAQDGYIYTSNNNGNKGNDPALNNGVNWTKNGPNAWSSSPSLYPRSTQWTPVYSNMTAVRLMEPLASGPLNTSQTRNLFHLPANYLARAPQNPKQGAGSPLGAPSGYVYNDWEYNGDWIVSSQETPILFRFIAAIRKVTDMTGLFCTALAARMAMETASILTQGDEKFQKAGSEYRLAVTDARVRNAIEQGFEEMPEDEYIQVRY